MKYSIRTTDSTCANNKSIAAYSHLFAHSIALFQISKIFRQLRHKAAEVIRQQLETRETPLLYCMLGDATDDIEHYNKGPILM